MISRFETKLSENRIITTHRVTLKTLNWFIDIKLANMNALICRAASKRRIRLPIDV